MEIGRLGVAFRMDKMTASETAKFAERIEAMGYRLLWIPEDTGREPFTHAAYLLGKTERLGIATGIANIWLRDATTTAAAAATLAELSADRFVLGLGVSHAPLVAQQGHTYHKPLSYMREYLAGIQKASYSAARPRHEVPIVLAALKPKMLRLAASLTKGVLVAFVTPEFTAKVRTDIGPKPWLCVDQLVIAETDPGKARRIARALLEHYVPALSNYTDTLRSFGWSDGDFADGCSDRLVDALVAWGTADQIKERVDAHLDAGATHVCVAPIRSDGSPMPDERVLEALAARSFTERGRF